MEKEIRSVRFGIKPFTKLSVGDELYFEQLENPQISESISSLLKNDITVRDEDVGKFCKYASVIVTEVQYSKVITIEGKDHPFNNIRVSVQQAATEAILKTYEDGKYFPDQVDKEQSLGCDTAAFILSVGKSKNMKSTVIKTLSDGWFGYFLKMKDYYGMILSFEVCDDAYFFEEMINEMKAVFL